MKARERRLFHPDGDSTAASSAGTYSKDYFEENGVHVHEIPFPDGDPPSTEVIQEFLGVRRGGESESARSGFRLMKMT